MAAEIRNMLEMEKLRQDIETELARRDNWAAQEAAWLHEAKMSRGRNYIALAAITAILTAAIVATLAEAGMTTDSNIVLEQLRAIRAEQTNQGARLERIELRLGVIEQRLSAMELRMAELEVSMRKRIDRIDADSN